MRSIFVQSDERSMQADTDVEDTSGGDGVRNEVALDPVAVSVEFCWSRSWAQPVRIQRGDNVLKPSLELVDSVPNFDAVSTRISF